jgi:predicted secreted protein
MAVPGCEGLSNEGGATQTSRRRLVPQSPGQAEVITWTSPCPSECSDPTDQPPPDPVECPGISISVSDYSTIHFHHRPVEVNYCTEASTQVEIDGRRISIFEQETGEPCDCVCQGGFGGHISNLALGLYDVELWSSQGELLCQRTVRISERDCLTEEDSGRIIHIRSGRLMHLCLAENPSTGASWNLEELDEEIVRPLCQSFIHTDSGMVGTTGELKWFFQANQLGETTMVLRRYRTWTGPTEQSPVMTLHIVVH